MTDSGEEVAEETDVLSVLWKYITASQEGLMEYTTQESLQVLI